MIRKIFHKFLTPAYPAFKNISSTDVPSQLLHQYNNPIFWTPKFQRIPYSESLTKYLRYLQRNNKMTTQDFRNMTENIIIEYQAINGRDIFLNKDVKIPANVECPYHGEVDWMLSLENKKYTPIMFCPKQLNHSLGIAMALSNLNMRLSEESNELEQVYGYSIITNGQEWQIIRISKYMKLQKTIIIEGKNKFRNMHEDEQMVSVVLGMLNYSLSRREENMKVLDKAYEYLDERIYMLEAKSREEANKSSIVSKILTEYHKRRY